MKTVLTLFLLLWGMTSQPATLDMAPFQAEQLATAIEEVRQQQNESQETEPPFPIDQNIGTADWVKADPQKNTAPTVRGIFSTANSADLRLDSMIELINSTDLNAIVIDVKEDFGHVTFETGNPEIEKWGTTKKIIRDIDTVIQKLEENDIYPIARIVVFKDTTLANMHPEYSFLNENGSVWHNSKDTPEAFVNPYRKEVWEYNVEVAKAAIEAGFKEIQFDYVRFPEGFEHRAETLTYTRDPERSRAEAVADFVKYAREQLNPTGARISVDIFGYAASVDQAEGIGQDFNMISQYVDVICPMVYPSHYSTGWFGSRVPDLAPYTTIFGSMMDTQKKLEQIKDKKPVIRAWLQDFTASWLDEYIPYGKKEVEEQIRGMYDAGVYEFLLWNSSNVYTEGVDYTLGRTDS